MIVKRNHFIFWLGRNIFELLISYEYIDREVSLLYLTFLKEKTALVISNQPIDAVVKPIYNHIW